MNTIQTPNVLTSGSSGSGGSNATTASFSPAIGQLIVLDVFNKGPNNTTANNPSLSGISVSWISVYSHRSSFSNGEWLITRYVGVIASVQSGTLTIDFSGQNQQAIAWVVTQFTNNVRLDLNNPNNSIVQNASSENNTTVTTQNVTLSPFTNPLDATLAAFADDGQADFSGATGMTTLVQIDTGYAHLLVVFNSTEVDSITANYTGNNATGKVAIASEIAFLPDPQSGML